MKFKRKPPQGNVRRVASNGQSIRGVITNKAGRVVQFESWAERSLLLRLERDPDVADYGSQPERFRYVDPQGHPHTYVPDFIVWRRDGRVEIHEVTVSGRRAQPAARWREAAADEICRARGWLYVVHTERSLPQGGELATLLALLHFRPAAYANPDVAEAAFERLMGGQAVSLHALIGQIARDLEVPEPGVAAALAHMLWHGQIATDLSHLIFVDGALSPAARVWLAAPRKEGEGHAAHS
jgi:hypothetical protein